LLDRFVQKVGNQKKLCQISIRHSQRVAAKWPGGVWGLAGIKVRTAVGLDVDAT
jgi:hypothetical protein